MTINRAITEPTVNNKDKKITRQPSGCREFFIHSVILTVCKSVSKVSEKL